MIKYFIYLPLMLICMLLCYITNPLVVLFANEEGELPKVFKLWQTWDDTVDNKGFIDNSFPRIFWYDWSKHYKQYTGKIYGNRTRYYQELIEPLSMAEKIKRYFCRVGWLTRNCGYGFAYYLFGINVNQQDMQRIYGKYQVIDGRTHAFEVWTKKDTNILIAPFRIKNDLRFFNNKLEFNWYLGWKVALDLYEPHRAMIANRISIRIVK